MLRRGGRDNVLADGDQIVDRERGSSGGGQNQMHIHHFVEFERLAVLDGGLKHCRVAEGLTRVGVLLTN